MHIFFLIYCAGSSPRYWSEYYSQRESEKISYHNPTMKNSCPELDYCYRQCFQKQYWGTSLYYKSATQQRSHFSDRTGHYFQCEIDCRSQVFCPASEKTEKKKVSR